MAVQKNAIGVVIEIEIQEDDAPRDIGGATKLEMIFKKPITGTLETRTGVLSSGGTDGKYRYTTVANDLDEAGLWKVQSDIIVGTFNGKSDVGAFPVEDNLETGT